MAKRKICPCGERSIPGLVASVALCQRHYNGLMFGTGEEHSEAKRLLNQLKAAHEKPAKAR